MRRHIEVNTLTETWNKMCHMRVCPLYWKYRIMHWSVDRSSVTIYSQVFVDKKLFISDEAIYLWIPMPMMILGARPLLNVIDWRNKCLPFPPRPPLFACLFAVWIFHQPRVQNRVYNNDYRINALLASYKAWSTTLVDQDTHIPCWCTHTYLIVLTYLSNCWCV